MGKSSKQGCSLEMGGKVICFVNWSHWSCSRIALEIKDYLRDLGRMISDWLWLEGTLMINYGIIERFLVLVLDALQLQVAGGGETLPTHCENMSSSRPSSFMFT